MDVPLLFGPVPSRRLGRSLGINHVPPKHCTYSCVYCQVGATRDTEVEPRRFRPAQELVAAARARVAELRARGQSVDYLTFVPDGEPALDAELGAAIDGLRPLGLPIAVISNGSLASRADARAALARADWVSFKVDAVDEPTWRRVNRPDPRLELAAILEGMRRFAREFRGTLCTETMLVQGLNDGDAQVEAVAGFLAELRPHVAWLAVPTRPPAEPDVRPPDEARVNAAFQRLAARLPRVELLTGFEGTDFLASGDPAEALVAIGAVHPLREDAALALLARAGAGPELLEQLLRDGRLKRVEHEGHAFYLPALSRPAALDPVEEAGRESFPASDPPAWWAGADVEGEPGP